MSYSNVYAQALNIDINTLSQNLEYLPIQDSAVPVDAHIPSFLIKRS
jgi:hypothetical protein